MSNPPSLSNPNPLLNPANLHNPNNPLYSHRNDPAITSLVTPTSTIRLADVIGEKKGKEKFGQTKRGGKKEKEKEKKKDGKEKKKTEEGKGAPVPQTQFIRPT